jgi:hypothetical protein
MPVNGQLRFLRKQPRYFRQLAEGSPSFAEGKVTFFDVEHKFREGTAFHLEMVPQAEMRAVGFSSVWGRITENQIRKELGLCSRAAYLARRDWIQ